MFARLKQRPLESYNKAWLATVSLTVVAVVVAGMLVFGKLSVGRTQYRAEFAQAASIRSGDRVTVAGIQVGTVTGLRLAGDRVVVSFTAADDVVLGSETRAAIKLTTLLGARYIELSPASGGDLKERMIPLANTVVPYDLQATLADATTTFEQVDADRIAQSVTTLSQSLVGVPEALPEALANLKSLSGIIAGRRDQLHTLLASADAVTATIRDQKSALGSLVIQGQDLLAQVANRRAKVEQLFASATTLVDRISTILDDEPNVNQLISAISDLMRRIASNDALLRNTLQILPVSLRNLANATGSGVAADGTLPTGMLIDSWMCAISGRAKQFKLPEYFNDCQPVPDPFPGWPPPQPAAAEFPGFPPESLETPAPAPAPATPAPATPGGPTP